MNLVKCRVKYRHKLYPKTIHNSGEFAIMKFEVIEVLEGGNINEIAIFKGNMCEIVWDEVYTVVAEEVIDPTWGKQYNVKYIGQPASLSTVEEQRLFLSKVLTDNQVQNLFETFSDPLQVILSRDIEKLCQVKGIGATTATKLIDKVYYAMDFSKAYIELDNYGLTNNMIEKLVGVYGSPEIVVQKIKENPYILASEVEGIGFRKADDIALKNGYTWNNPKRLFCLSQYILKEYANSGHSYVLAYDFIDRVYEETEDLDEESLGEVIKSNDDFYVFNKDGDRYIALRKIYDLEKRVAEELLRLRDGNNNFDYNNWRDRVKQIEQEQGWEHTDEQLNAIEELLKNQVIVITGYGGTGKSSSVKAVREILNKYYFAQTALSGRASSRMAEITGEEGYTIHRLLGYHPRTGFAYNKDNQLEVDVVVVDEVSMIGGEIFLKLIEAIPTGSKLVLLGDEGQLESIGTMNILHDLINTDVIKSCRLTKIHRQAAKSGIIEASLKIRNGEQFFDRNFEGQIILGELQDCELNIVKDRAKLPMLIEDQFKHWLKKIDNINELQVIVPMKEKGDVSCLPLNIRLQKIFNPDDGKKKSIKITKNKTEFEIRVGDKVINRKNNYKTVNMGGQTTPIFNGNIGIVKEVYEPMQTAIIDFYGIGEVMVNREAIQGIELGYAITTHSSQGSQFDVVIYAIDQSSYILLNREQAYTGVTRAKKYCIVNAENQSLRHAIKTSEVRNKQTFLKDILFELDKK